jgi:fructoselysine-6-P-deglycase FrlB-like protein
MLQLNDYIERAKASEYFSGARLSDDLTRFFAEQGDAARALAKLASSAGRLFLVGSGGSLANLQIARYVLDRLVPLPTDALTGYELIWRAPPALNNRALAVFCSYSGDTEDTVAALRFAKECGAPTVGIVNERDCAIGREADVVIPYHSPAILEAPVAALVLMACELAKGGPRADEALQVAASLAELPAVVGRAFAEEEQRAEARARQFLNTHHLYVLGAGPLAPLAYKVALTVVMENLRIGGTFCDASEFRHGPAEALERTQMDMIVLLGTDASREMAQRALAFCEEHGARTLVYDATEYDGVHPLLTPLVLNSVIQWFVVYSAILRGITDLDDRVFMGRRALAKEGYRWP